MKKEGKLKSFNENSTLGEIVNNALTNFEWRNEEIKKNYNTHFMRFASYFDRKVGDIEPAEYLMLMEADAKKGLSYDTVSMRREALMRAFRIANLHPIPNIPSAKEAFKEIPVPPKRPNAARKVFQEMDASRLDEYMGLGFFGGKYGSVKRQIVSWARTAGPDKFYVYKPPQDLSQAQKNMFRTDVMRAIRGHNLPYIVRYSTDNKTFVIVRDEGAARKAAKGKN